MLNREPRTGTAVIRGKSFRRCMYRPPLTDSGDHGHRFAGPQFNRLSFENTDLNPE